MQIFLLDAQQNPFLRGRPHRVLRLVLDEVLHAALWVFVRPFVPGIVAVHPAVLPALQESYHVQHLVPPPLPFLIVLQHQLHFLFKMQATLLQKPLQLLALGFELLFALGWSQRLVLELQVVFELIAVETFEIVGARGLVFDDLSAFAIHPTT